MPRRKHGDLTGLILDALSREPMTPPELAVALGAGRDASPTPPSAAVAGTVLARLYEKGRVERESEGRSFRYSLARPEADLDGALRRIVTAYGDDALVAMRRMLAAHDDV